MKMPERRRRRSAKPAEAVHLYLRQLADRRGHGAVVLADCCGHLVAGTDRGDATAIAAAAPLAHARPRALPPAVSASITGGVPLRVWHLRLFDADFYLAATGGDASPPEEAAPALSRILHRAA